MQMEIRNLQFTRKREDKHHCHTQAFLRMEGQNLQGTGQHEGRLYIAKPMLKFPAITKLESSHEVLNVISVYD